MKDHIAIVHEPSNVVCERGHRVRKYYFDLSAVGHDLLCPHCDKEIIQQRIDSQRAKAAEAMTRFLDDDENIKAMRETAREVGLTGVLLQASQSDDALVTKELLRRALRTLGESR